MKTIRFPDANAERRALDLLIGEFSFTTWATGEMLIPEAALSALTQAGIPFSVEGSQGDRTSVPPVRDSASSPVQ